MAILMDLEDHFCFLTSEEKKFRYVCCYVDTYLARFPDVDGEFPVLDEDALRGVHGGDGLRY